MYITYTNYKKMKIVKKFLKLTSQTIPHGMENLLIDHLPKGYQTDKFGNYFITVGENFTTMFTCHLDTASREHQKITHIREGNFIHSDGKTILGADDKAGMTILLYMISKGVPGLYYFFVGEEVGCIGSRALSKNWEWSNITKVISFDRRGTNSVITEQMYGRCCSDEFALALSNKLNSQVREFSYKPDNTGILTDSAQFIDLVPECTNISVGYYHEHTNREKQDIEHLLRLCRAVVKVDWEDLPIVRKPDDVSVELEEIEDLDELIYSDLMELEQSFEEWREDLFTWIPDERGMDKKVYISSTWVEKEKKMIARLLKSFDFGYEELYWNGYQCYTIEFGQEIYVGNRNDLMSYINELQEIPVSHTKTQLDDFDLIDWSCL